MGLFGGIKQRWKDGSLMNGLQAAGAMAHGDYGTAAEIMARHRRSLGDAERYLYGALPEGPLGRGAPPAGIPGVPTEPRPLLPIENEDVWRRFEDARRLGLPLPLAGGAHDYRTPGVGAPFHAVGLPIGRLDAGAWGGPANGAIMGADPFESVIPRADSARAAPDAELNSELAPLSDEQREAMLRRSMESTDMPARTGGANRHGPTGRIPLESVAQGPIPYGDQEGSGRVHFSLKTAREKLAQAAAIQALLDRIALGEGTDEAMARAKGYTSGYDVTLGYGAYATPNKPLSQMTLGEVIALQQQMLRNPRNKLHSTAVGRYQILGGTLRPLMGRLGYTDKTTFSPDVQDRMARQLLVDRGLTRYLNGQIDANQFQINLSNEWASIEDPTQGISHYGQPLGTTSSEIQSIISTLLPPP